MVGSGGSLQLPLHCKCIFQDLTASITFTFHSPPNEPKEVSLQKISQLWQKRSFFVSALDGLPTYYLTLSLFHFKLPKAYFPKNYNFFTFSEFL